MLYFNNSYFLFYWRYYFGSIDYGNYYGSISSISSILSIGFVFIGVSGYSGDRRWTGEFGIILNLVIKFGELEIYGFRENFKFLIIDFSRNFLFLFYFSFNYE